MQIHNFMRESGRIRIDASAVTSGNDGYILLSGGDSPHIGALAFGASAGESGAFTFSGHKEDVVVERIARRVRAEELFRNYAIGCGIHVDNISKAEIELVLQMCDDLLADILSALTSEVQP